MFKMGCSMARRILAIDGKGSNPSGQDQIGAGCSSSSSPAANKNQGRKDKHHLAGGSGSCGRDSAPLPAATTAAATTTTTAPKTKTTEELNDFSKLEDDPRIPLNVRQIFKITKSWKAIARTMSKTGTAMFLNLFEQNQDLFYLFARFQHLKGKDLHESMELREHAATVMSTLDQSINSLSDYDNFVNYLHSIGKLHRKVPGFKRAYFWKIEQPFLKAVKQTLDERCNETIEEIYKIAIKLILETIADGFGEDQPEPGNKLDVDRDKPASADGGDNANGGGRGAGRHPQRPTNSGDEANEHNTRGGQVQSQFLVKTTAAKADGGALATIDPRPEANFRGNNSALTRFDLELDTEVEAAAAKQLDASSEPSSAAPSRTGSLLLLASTSPIDEEALQQLDNGQNVGVRGKEACVYALPGGHGDGGSLSPGKHRTTKKFLPSEGGGYEATAEALLAPSVDAASGIDSSGHSLRSTLFVLRELLFLSLKTEIKRQQQEQEEKPEPEEKKAKRKHAKEEKTKAKKREKFEVKGKGAAKAFNGRHNDDDGAAFIGQAKKAPRGTGGSETCSWLTRLAGNSISSNGCPKLSSQLNKQTTKAKPSPPPPTSLSSKTTTKDCTDDWLAATATRAKTKPIATSTKAGQDRKRKNKEDICNCKKGGNNVCDDNNNDHQREDNGSEDDDWRSRELNTSCRHHHRQQQQQHRPEPFLLSSSLTPDIIRRSTAETAATCNSTMRDLQLRETTEAQVCKQTPPPPSECCSARSNNKALTSSIYLASADGEQERRAETTIVGLQQAQAQTNAQANVSACATRCSSVMLDVSIRETTSLRATAATNDRQTRIGGRGGEKQENTESTRTDGRLDSCLRQMARLQQADLAGASQTTTSCCQYNNASEFGGHQKAINDELTTSSVGEPGKVCVRTKNKSSNNNNRQNECRHCCFQSLAWPLSDSSSCPRSLMGAASGEGRRANTGRARSVGQLTSSSLLAESQAALESPDSLEPAQSFNCRCQMLACESPDCSCSNSNERSSGSSIDKARRNNGECRSKFPKEFQADTWSQLDCSPVKPTAFAKAVTADERDNQACPASAIKARATAARGAATCCPLSRRSATSPTLSAHNCPNSAASIGLPTSKSPSVWCQIKDSSSSLLLSASRRTKRREGRDLSDRLSTATAAIYDFRDDGGARCARNRSNNHKACRRSTDTHSNANVNKNSLGTSQPELKQPFSTPKQQLHNFLLTSDRSELSELIKMLMLAVANRNSRKAPDRANGHETELSSPLWRHDNDNIATIATTTSISLKPLSTNC